MFSLDGVASEVLDRWRERAGFRGMLDLSRCLQTGEILWGELADMPMVDASLRITDGRVLQASWGFREGDALVTMRGNPVETVSEIVRAARGESSPRVTIVRGGELTDVTVTPRYVGTHSRVDLRFEGEFEAW